MWKQSLEDLDCKEADEDEIIFFQSIEAAQTGSDTQDDAFTKSFQAKWFNDFSSTLCDQLSASTQNVPIDPKVVVQDMIGSLRDESAGQEKQLADFFANSLEDLMNDNDFDNLLREFQEAINGERDILTIGILVVWWYNFLPSPFFIFVKIKFLFCYSFCSKEAIYQNFRKKLIQIK